MGAARRIAMTGAGVAVARNAPCPCGSGKRYKECHGAPQASPAHWVDRALRELRARDFDAAEASLREADALAPDDPRILANLGTVYARQRRLSEAEAALARAHSIAPEQPYPLTLLAHVRQRLCAWGAISDLHTRIGRLLDADDDTAADFNPFVLLAMPTTPRQQLVAARRFARRMKSSPVPGTPISSSSSERLRIGFVSSDLRSHATVSLMLEFWQRIDRKRLETFAYGILARDSGPFGRTVEAAFEHFADVADEPDERIAQRIRDDRIGILFDLNGYTRNGRPGIFAFRPSPVQINAIGFQCTVGTPWHDYILTDRFALREDSGSFFTERPLYLPHSLYPSDTTRLTGAVPRRGECALPERGFVFCCFNHAYKILPEIFAVWMRLLARLPGSVLWLLDTGAEAKANLRREAAAAGLDPQRLIFAPRVAVGAHVARNAVADLFLDTYPYGAHTTANDALLAGLPLLTLAGETLASRIAGSQLLALGLPELITTSLADYEALALALASEPKRLAAVRAKLMENRRQMPLFDMQRYARDFESAMEQIWTEHVNRR